MTQKNDILFEDITERQLQLLRVDAGIRRKVLRQLKKLERSLAGRITDEDSFTQRRLRAMFKDTKEFIKETYRSINELTLEDMIALGTIESTATARMLTNIAVDTIALPLQKVTSLVKGALMEGAPSEDWWGRQSNSLTRKFEDQMRIGVLSGETNQQLVRRVRGSRAFGFTDGIMNTSRREAEALVRSSVLNAANHSRFETMEQNNDVIKSYRHVSTLDSRTTTICIVRDGKRWKADTKQPINHSLPFRVPPVHWNCRSTLIPEVPGVNVTDEINRASADGPVPGNTTFEDFLNSKGKAFADEVLGKGKAELWRDGTITLRQLLDQSGNPLTLKELRTKYGS